MASLIAWLKFAGARTTLGDPVSSGTADFFVPGSSVTRVATWQDSGGTVALTQPVPLNAAGQAEVWTSAPCDVVIKNSLGVQVSLVSSEAFGGNSAAAAQVEVVSDYFTGNHGVDYAVSLPVPLSTVVDRIGASIGLDGSFKESETTGVVARTVHSVLAGLCITPYDFGANGAGTADDTVPLQRAIDRAGALGVPLYLGAGIYRITAGLTVSAECHIVGAGKGKSVIRSTSSAFSMLTIACAAGRRTGERFAWSLRDFSIEAPTGTNANNYGITVNVDTVLLKASGGTIDNVDVTAGLGIDVSGAASVRVSNCNVIVQQGTTEAVGIDIGAYGSAINCRVDGVAFSASHVSTGIKLGFYATAERCFVTNCTSGIECKPACTAAIARNCEVSACGTSVYVRGSRSGAECCDSSSATVTAFKVDSSLVGIVDVRNSWTPPATTLASDFSSPTDASYADVTGLSINLVSGVTYDIECYLAVTCNATQGIRIGNTGGTATFSAAVKPRVLFQSSGSPPGIADVEYIVAGPTPLEMTVNSTGFASIRYLATCTATGTFFPQLAQSVAGAEAAVIKAGSWVRAVAV